MQYLFMIKALHILEIEGNFLSVTRTSMKNPQLTSYLMAKDWKRSLWDQELGKDAHSHHFYYITLYNIYIYNVMLEVLTRAIRQEKASR